LAFLENNKDQEAGMETTEIFKIILLILLIVCAVAVNLTRNLLKVVVIFMSYSSIMCIIWILMESPDLAITEAAVGAGVSGILFLVTLRKIREEDEKNADPAGDGKKAGLVQAGKDAGFAGDGKKAGAVRAGKNAGFAENGKNAGAVKAGKMKKKMGAKRK